MIVSINQPAYLPWPGYFHRVAASDLHVVLDHVQFEKNSFVNRNRIRTSEGWGWLTVPLRTRGRFGQLAIDAVEIADDGRWARKHWDSLRFAYAGAPHFAQHAAFFEDAYGRQWSRLRDLLAHTTEFLLRTLGIATPMQSSRSLGPSGRADEMLLDVCRRLGATVYLSGPLGRNYLREALFHDAGIEVRYDDYVPPSYGQAHPGFVPGLSVVDLLFNCGPDSRDVLMSVGGDARVDEGARR